MSPLRIKRQRKTALLKSHGVRNNGQNNFLSNQAGAQRNKQGCRVRLDCRGPTGSPGPGRAWWAACVGAAAGRAQERVFTGLQWEVSV